MTLGQVLDSLHAQELVEIARNEKVNEPVTLGNVIDFAAGNQALQSKRDRTVTLKAKLGDIFEIFGEEELKELVQRKTAEASRKPEYERSEDNIVGNWTMLAMFALLFAVLSILSLEMIDKDMR